MTKLIDKLLSAYKEQSFERVTLLSMFNYLQYELMFYSRTDRERARQLAITLSTYARANSYNALVFESLITIYNIIVEHYNTSEYRLLIANTDEYDVRVVDDTSYELYITDSVHDICDIQTESVFA